MTIVNTVAVLLDDTWYWGLLIVCFVALGYPFEDSSNVSFTVQLSSTMGRVPLLSHPVPSLASVQLFFRPPNVL